MNDLRPDPDSEDVPEDVPVDEEAIEELPVGDVSADDESVEESDDDDDDDDEGEPEPVLGDHIDYEIDDWSGQSRALLDSMLGAEGIAHIWQGTTLMVGVDDETATDALIEVVNQTATQGLDPDRTRVVYEVGTWSAAMQTSLAEALGVADIAFEWDENGDLVIYEDDEEHVEEVLDGMPDPDDPDAVDAEGVDVQAILTRLWEATGTLSRKPDDAEAVLAAIDSADRVEHIGLPFGFESSVWRNIVAKTLALRAALDSDDEDDQLSDDDLVEGCAELHNQLRQFI